MTRDRQAAVGVVTYVALMAAWIYAGENASLRYGHEGLYGIPSLTTLVALHLGLGLLVARWWALFVYAVPVLPGDSRRTAALPVPGQGGPIWRGLLLIAPVAVGLVALGIALRRLSLVPARR